MRSTAAIHTEDAAGVPATSSKRQRPHAAKPIAAMAVDLPLMCPDPAREPDGQEPEGQEARDRTREERVIELCQCMMEIVAALFNVPSRELQPTARGGLAAARLRQIAMYVSHVACSLSMSEVGQGFGRDRTTVRHACHLIEDMCDDGDFDAIIVTAERVARAALRRRSGV